MRHTVQHLVEFILLHRRGNVFRNWTGMQIASKLMEKLDTGEMSYGVSTSGEIVGVVVGTRHNSEKRFHVDEILTTETGMLSTFMARFHLHYPGWSMTAERHGHLVTYNVPKLLQKLTYGRT